MENKDFCVFIISHGRANEIKTIDTLKKCGYTGLYYIILDNEDKTIQSYIHKYGEDKIIVFNKKYYADLVDEGNNFDNRKTTTHARNACFDIAKNLNITYFIVLDDDYTNFRYRFVDKYITKGYVLSLDKMFDSLLNFYKNTNFKSIAFAQGGDFIGGDSCGLLKNYLYNSRKCMNSFICSTEREFNFFGQLNEDVNTYVVLGSKGDLFLTIPHVGLEQMQTQKTTGGMTDAYLRYGTYIKSFTTVMMHPSSVKVSMMGFTSNRLHHLVKWRYTTPMILEEKYKK
jgi:hypothetical protein